MAYEDFGLISVIMAAYNVEKTIEQAIDSVLEQTYPNLELLVVDDFSTDRTAELVACIAAKDCWVRLISNEKDSGVVLYAQARFGRSKRGLDCDSQQRRCMGTGKAGEAN